MKSKMKSKNWKRIQSTSKSGTQLAALFAAVMLVAPAAGAPAPVPESPLALVPADAPVVIQVRGVEGAKKRLFGMVKNAVPDLAQAAQKKLDEVLKDSLRGRQFRGLAEDGPVFVVLTQFPKPKRQEPPALAVI